MFVEDYFPGLIPLICTYLDHIQCDHVTMERMTKYLDFIEKRATGELLTPAAWIRKFVRSHEDYKFDSVVLTQLREFYLCCFFAFINFFFTLMRTSFIAVAAGMIFSLHVKKLEREVELHQSYLETM